MARKLKTKPSFFKVLVSDFTRQLRLPPGFVEKHRKILPKNVKLKISSGKTWDVKFEPIDDEHCFTNGWSDFVRDLRLKQGEFVVFCFNCDKLTFDVSVYLPNGYEKELLGSNSVNDVKFSEEDLLLIDREKINLSKQRGRKRGRKRITEDKKNSKDEAKKQIVTSVVENGAGSARRTKCDNSWPQFQVKMTISKKSRLCLSKAFAEEADLIGKSVAMLEYPPNPRIENVTLHNPRNMRAFRLEMTGGWPKFRKENRLQIGKTYSFVYNPEKNVIQVTRIAAR